MMTIQGGGKGAGGEPFSFLQQADGLGDYLFSQNVSYLGAKKKKKKKKKGKCKKKKKAKPMDY